MNPTMEITVQLPCPNNCDYCPQTKLMSKYDGIRKMVLKKFYDWLDQIPKNVRIDFSGFCEPFYHEDARKMMQKAHSLGFKVVLYTTLAGITQEDISYLSASTKFDLIMIHCPDKEHYTNGGTFKEKVGWFTECYPDCQFMAMGPVPDRIIHAVPGPIQYPTMLSRGSNGRMVNRVPLKRGPITCSISGETFDHNVLLPNGDVHFCCMDYDLNYKLGNISKQTYEQIMNGEPAQRFAAAAASEDGDVLCRRCEWGQV